MHKHFPSDFYVTCATVIPVLFLAYAVQGRVYVSLLRASFSGMRASLPSAKVNTRRWRGALAGPLLLRSVAYAIVLAGAYGEFSALSALYSGSEQPGQRVQVFVMTLVLLVAVVVGPLWTYAKLSVAEDMFAEKVARDQRREEAADGDEG
jgi:hypothetical protein